MMTGITLILLLVAVLLHYHGAVVVRAEGPVAAATDDFQSGYIQNLTSSYKYVTLHNHRGHNCSREIRYNVTFHLDACIHATFPWFHGSTGAARVNSFSFYYNINNTGYDLDDDNWLQRERIYMISYTDDACTPTDFFDTDEGYYDVDEPSTCKHGFSYTISNELAPVTSAASYIK
jgi:hypothetical protein